MVADYLFWEGDLIIQKQWLDSDEKELQDSISKVERLKSKKAMIERIQRKQWEDRFPSRYVQSKPSNLKCTYNKPRN